MHSSGARAKARDNEVRVNLHMNVYFVYKMLTNRIRALIIAAGYIQTPYSTAARFKALI